jgi:hypothetical protein
MDRGMFAHAHEDHKFKNEYLFYRFAEDSRLQGFTEIIPGCNFYRNETDFLFGPFGGLINVNTQMGMIRLTSGKFLLLSACALSPLARSQLLHLTNQGALVEAVVATHPFHTLAFAKLREVLPNAPFYGTPRHLRNFPQLNWSGDISDRKNIDLWAPEVEFRVCGRNAGVEFDSPVPPQENHVGSVIAFHRESKTIFCDDTIQYAVNPGTILQFGGFKPGVMRFHSSLEKPFGFLPYENSSQLFQRFISGIITDWDFSNICCAHLNAKIGGAKDDLLQALVNARPTFQKHAIKHAGKTSNLPPEWGPEDLPECDGMEDCG